MLSNRFKKADDAGDATGFTDNREHLRAEFDWLELVVKRALLKAMIQTGDRRPFDEFSGMYISHQEITEYLDNSAETMTAHVVDQDPRVPRIDAAIRRMRQVIDQRLLTTRERNTHLRLPNLMARFSVHHRDEAMLLCCLAADLSPVFQRSFAFLQNDVAKKRPSIRLLTQLFRSEDESEDGWEMCHRLGSSSPLFKSGLLQFPRNTNEAIFAAREPRVPPSVIDYLNEVDHLDEAIAGFSQLLAPRPIVVDTDYRQRHQTIQSQVLRIWEVDRRRPPVYLFGPNGSGKSALAESIAHAMGRMLLRIPVPQCPAIDANFNDAVPLIAREARMHHCLVQLDGIDELPHGGDPIKSRSRSLVDRLVDQVASPIIMTGTFDVARIRMVVDTQLLGFEIPYPTIEQRSQLWRRRLESQSSPFSDEAIDAIAAKFKFTPGQVESALNMAGTITESPVTLDLLQRCCREASSQGLLHFAQKIAPKYRWDDIVLPPDTRRQLEEICLSIKHRRTVFSGWGFEAKFSLGKGVNVLFSGASGTGKTMSSEIIASDLALDIFKIDLSCVVSKYVGETERNLSRIFQEAETANCILFFDEADALFGKRSEVKDAHDRYANIEINFLLQKMDEYEGIIILATNLKNNLDSAFLRRLHHVIEYPFPDQNFRHLIWDKVFPRQTPLTDGIDFDFMAKKFKLSGGNIKNIALSSAFLAAADDRAVTMEHLILATRREYQKMGKLCSKSEFGPYYSLVRAEALA